MGQSTLGWTKTAYSGEQTSPCGTYKVVKGSDGDWHLFSIERRSDLHAYMLDTFYINSYTTMRAAKLATTQEA